MPTICPCGSKKEYIQCCSPFIYQQSLPRTPEQLMRSRYTAFVEKQADYLLKTLHPSKITENTQHHIQSTINTTQWLSLKVIDSGLQKGRKDIGWVEFVAFYHNKNTPDAVTNVDQLHEKSQFIFEQQWFYTQGDILPAIKLGRNDPCWCGSGKKLKTCHKSL